MSDEMNMIPDYLMSALELEAETGALNLFSDTQSTTPKLRRIEFVQRSSTKHAGQVGKIFISGATAEDEGEYRASLDFLLMQSILWNLTTANLPPDDLLTNPEIKYRLRNGLGGMTMWQFDEKGDRVTDAKAPVCSSPNGVQVWNNLVGKEVDDYRSKKTERIGFDMDESGNYAKREHSCIGCPLREWYDTGELTGTFDRNGDPETRKLAPMCNETFGWLVWSIDDQELMMLKGVNRGVQMALTGTPYSKKGRRWDDVPFKGIEHYFSMSGQYKTEGGKAVASFYNQPQGRPSIDNPTAPVYAVRMSVTTNNFSPVTLVPQFTVLDGKTPSVVGINLKSKSHWMDGAIQIPTEERRLSAAEYVSFLNAMQDAINGDYKAKFMATQIIHRKGQASGGIAGELEAPMNMGQLPTGAVADTAKDLDSPFGFND